MTTMVPTCEYCGRHYGDHFYDCPNNKEDNPPPKSYATTILAKAAAHMEERGRTYDAPGGERSMGKTVAAFNAITGAEITEAQGWLLMQLLKDVRLFTRPGYHADSAEDAIAYAALKAEAKQKEAE